ncbi:recombination protein NinB [Salmonella enterica subsp. enterica serovar Amsterdam]|uniref:recombination protein NinB n=1 Tax=Salmonella enterica TaxID=28901 RepID=UPI000FB4E8AE|nr:recombination protein NinB [Salmonella enterica]EBZ2079388.1 recombination protein NinB [Salmonella enterica subsp. enterica serovar Amsterdam]EEJ8645570.1 recombination protein NinB [Salmonella enterica subsp. enterica]EBD8775931.1 recombination protein NinB [Salmonella enterica]EBO7011960.1 recombination protein NinB [Salmonella enterica]
MKQLFLLRNEAIRNNAIDAILSLPIDNKSPHEVHVKAPKRTKAQNDRMWPMLHDVSRQVLWHGQRLSPEDWKDIFTALWLKTKKLEQRSVPGIDGGVVLLGVRTSKMRKASMTELIEIMFWFGSERNVRWSDDSRREYEWSQRTGRVA